MTDVRSSTSRSMKKLMLLDKQLSKFKYLNKDRYNFGQNITE